jgi:tape measure domain-containing protein
VSTVFNVDLAFSAKTQQLDQVVNKINKFERDLARLKGSDPFQGVENSARGAQQAVDRVNTSARNAVGGFNALKGAIAGIGLLAVTKQVVSAAASYNDLQTRLKLLTSEYGDYAKAQSFVADSAKKFGLSNREAAAGFADIYARLRPVGIGLKDIETSFTGFNTLARLSGVSAEGASAAFTQLAQALGSGRLQGDEFRSIAEQVPGLLKAVSDETGISASKLKDYAAEGKLTSDIIIRALQRIEQEGAGKLGKLVGDSKTSKTQQTI